MSNVVAAVDLGATSGRVMLGHIGRDTLRLEAVARFPNGPIKQQDGLHWDASGLFGRIIEGLTRAATREPNLASIGVDSWAVDYGLLSGGVLRAQPFHYRHERVQVGVEEVHARIAPAELYAATGIQHLPFNTVYQLATDAIQGRLHGVDEFLLIPDLIAFWLTGVRSAERSNASTTGLLNVLTHEWDDTFIDRLDLPRNIFPPLVSAGTTIGSLLPSVASMTGLGAIEVTAVGSHDTASAVVAVPATGQDFAYISCGTWALVGVEIERPVLTEESRLANFTNEGGVDGRVRYLRNVMGLWLLNESVRGWGEDLVPMLAAAGAEATPEALLDVNDPRFLSPGDMPARIGEWLEERGQPRPRSRAAMVRLIIESLAEAFARTADEAAELSGTTVRVIHLVGGGSNNSLLCQLVADRSGLPVLAGPAEATALGNVLVQARSRGFVRGSLESMRSLVATAFEPVQYLPRSKAGR